MKATGAFCISDKLRDGGMVSFSDIVMSFYIENTNDIIENSNLFCAIYLYIIQIECDVRRKP